MSRDECSYPASMEGLYSRLPNCIGVDPWQAPQQAQKIIAGMLVCFVIDGGQLLDPEEREVVTPGELFPNLDNCDQQEIERPEQT